MIKISDDDLKKVKQKLYEARMLGAQFRLFQARIQTIEAEYDQFVEELRSKYEASVNHELVVDDGQWRAVEKK